MAKIRQIKPGFYSSPKLAKCSVNARFTFIGLLVFSDDHGVHQASALRLRMEVFPGDSCTVEDVSSWIDELMCAGLVLTFAAAGESYWHIVNFSKHQKVSRPYYCFPEPPMQGTDMDKVLLKHGRAVIEECPNTPGNGNVYGNDNGNGTDTGEAPASPHPPSKPKIIASTQISTEVLAVFEHWAKVMNHSRAKLDKRRQVKIKQALDMGYTVDELKQAVDGCSLTPFNMSQNDRHERYDALDLILRDAEHIDRFMANAVNPPTDNKASTEVFDFMVGVL
jgi:hypothetical protein